MVLFKYCDERFQLYIVNLFVSQAMNLTAFEYDTTTIIGSRIISFFFFFSPAAAMYIDGGRRIYIIIIK